MELFNHHWERQTQYKLNIFDLASIDNLTDSIDQIHEENLLLAGIDAVWLSRKTTGTKCSCWDRESQQGKIYKCSLCWGVGWVGGYLDPVEIKISYSPGKHQINIENLGLVIDVNPSAWTKKTSPPIKERDILVFKNDLFGSRFGNMRYYVSQSEESILGDNTRYQDLVLTYPGQDDVAWDISISGIYGGNFSDIFSFLNIGPIKSELLLQLTIRNPWWA